jgi:hypothetical protein
MANQRCAPGSEAQSDLLQATVNKALGYPIAGTHVGGGRHVDMPATWDGQGATPPGWTKHAVPVWHKDSATTWVPITDAMAAALQGGPAQARLDATERGRITAAIAARVIVDPEAQGASPKASAAGQAAQGAKDALRK